VTPDGLPEPEARLRFGFGGGRLDDVTVGSHPKPTFVTDKDGKFRIEGLVPGMKYHLQRGDKNSANIYKNLITKSGETRNLGDLKTGD
jgi:hypothetical protein